MSASPQKRTSERLPRYVRLVPKGDIRIAADFLIRSPRRRGRAASAAPQRDEFPPPHGLPKAKGSRTQYSRSGSGFRVVQWTSGVRNRLREPHIQRACEISSREPPSKNYDE